VRKLGWPWQTEKTLADDPRWRPPARAAFLALLCEKGAIRPSGKEWNFFYALERSGLAQKKGMNIFPTELGMIEYKKVKNGG